MAVAMPLLGFAAETMPGRTRDRISRCSISKSIFSKGLPAAGGHLSSPSCQSAVSHHVDVPNERLLVLAHLEEQIVQRILKCIKSGLTIHLGALDSIQKIT
jgi:hypothetical protein